MKGKALGKHSLHEKTAASVLLKLFTFYSISYLHKRNNVKSLNAANMCFREDELYIEMFINLDYVIYNTPVIDRIERKAPVRSWVTTG